MRKCSSANLRYQKCLYNNNNQFWYGRIKEKRSQNKYILSTHSMYLNKTAHFVHNFSIYIYI